MNCDLSAVKCVVINLPRAKARLRAIAGQFNQLNTDFETLEATDWRDLNELDYEHVDREARDKEGRRALSPAMIACHLSHRRAIAAAMRGQSDLTAIFEDDVTLAPSLPSVLQMLKRAHSAGLNFDIVFLHRIKTYLQFVTLKEIDDGLKLGVTKYSDRGALGYVISRGAAGKLFRRYPKMVHQLDHTLHAYWESGLDVFSLKDPVVFHGNEAGSHSFLQETAGGRSSRPARTLPPRFRSLLREEVLKRKFFRRRINSHDGAT